MTFIKGLGSNIILGCTIVSVKCSDRYTVYLLASLLRNSFNTFNIALCT